MKVSLTISALLLGVVLVNHAEAEIVDISAYDNVSKQAVSSLKKISDERFVSYRGRISGVLLIAYGYNSSAGGAARAMSSGHMFDGLLTKPVNSGARSSQDSYKMSRYIVYPSSSQAVYPQQPLKDGENFKFRQQY